MLANPKLSVGNCLKSTKMDYIVLYDIVEVLKNVNFLQLMKHKIQGANSTLILWVSPL